MVFSLPEGKDVMKLTIEGWHQPNGAGYGWAHCSDAKAELFFVFRDGVKVGQFETRAAAKDWIAEQNPASQGK